MWFVPLESVLANTWVGDQRLWQSDKQCTSLLQKKICTQLHIGITRNENLEAQDIYPWFVFCIGIHKCLWFGTFLVN